MDVEKKHPLDIDAIPIGLKLPFSSERFYFDSHYSTREQLKDNLKNLILTPTGFRPMNLQFGTGLYNLLFSQITQDSVARVREEIFSKVRRYIPQIELQSVEIGERRPHELGVKIVFRIPPDLEWDSLRFEVNG